MTEKIEFQCLHCGHENTFVRAEPEKDNGAAISNEPFFPEPRNETQVNPCTKTKGNPLTRIPDVRLRTPEAAGEFVREQVGNYLEGDWLNLHLKHGAIHEVEAGKIPDRLTLQALAKHIPAIRERLGVLLVHRRVLDKAEAGK